MNNHQALTFTSLSGAESHRHIHDLARLRIAVFRDFPYLYEGDLDYEARYLKTYLDNSDSLIVIVKDGEKIVGAATGIPLQAETEEVRRPFLAAGYNTDTIFYCGESVLLSAYRGRGAGVAFFQRREAHARQLGGMTSICFCAVQRPENHPARPEHYVPLDNFWQNRGYEKKPALHTTFSWQDVGDTVSTAKPMTFWMKAL